MKLKLTSLAMVLLAGCNNASETVQVLRTLLPQDPMKCTFTPSGEAALNLHFDVATQPTFSTYVAVRNEMEVTTYNIGTSDRPDLFISEGQVTPLRLDVRYECDAEGFSSSLGPLVLPRFDPKRPFCINQSTRDFVGFDVVLAYGGAIDGQGGLGIVGSTPISHVLTDGINDVFNFALKASDCCTSIGGCTEANLKTAPLGAGTKCGDLQAAFDDVAGAGNLSAVSVGDINEFLPYAAFDGTRGTQRVEVPTYPLRIRGIFEMVSNTGDLVNSNEYNDVIHICRNCLGSTACTNPF